MEDNVSKPLNTMDCTRSLRVLPRFLDGELAGQIQVALTQHLESCPACREELERLRADMSYLGGTTVPEFPPYIATRVMAEVRGRRRAPAHGRLVWGRVLGTAAAVLLVSASVGVGAVLGSGLGRIRTSKTASEALTVSSNEPTFADVLASVVEGE
jgi:anti-sigma factor RsiW